MLLVPYPRAEPASAGSTQPDRPGVRAYLSSQNHKLRQTSKYAAIAEFGLCFKDRPLKTHKTKVKQRTLD